MKKTSTVVMEGIQIFKPGQLTIGLDLGDRTSHYCILNEAGEVILESKLPTTPKGIVPRVRDDHFVPQLGQLPADPRGVRSRF